MGRIRWALLLSFLGWGVLARADGRQLSLGYYFETGPQSVTVASLSFCHGSIVAARSILTAAHCLQTFRDRKLILEGELKRELRGNIFFFPNEDQSKIRSGERVPEDYPAMRAYVVYPAKYLLIRPGVLNPEFDLAVIQTDTELAGPYFGLPAIRREVSSAGEMNLAGYDGRLEFLGNVDYEIRTETARLHAASDRLLLFNREAGDTVPGMSGAIISAGDSHEIVGVVIKGIKKENVIPLPVSDRTSAVVLNIGYHLEFLAQALRRFQ